MRRGRGMFDGIMRELRALERGVQVSVPITLNDDGYLDRRCPWAECEFEFKVLFDDWSARVDDVAHCPFCGHMSEAPNFNTPDQSEYLERAAMAELQHRFDRGFRSSAREFNRHSRGGFITMRMDVRTPPRTIALSPTAQEAMTLRITCEACGCRFAVIGAGYFCPACGHNSAGQTFDQSLATARAMIARLPEIRAAVGDRDAAAQVSRGIVESGVATLVTAFQRVVEVSFPRLPGAIATPRRNAFQNLQEGSQLWSTAGGRAYATILASGELTELQRLFQQRHLLAHRQGLVDQDYIARSGDTTYAVGQRLVIREQAVLRLVTLLEKLVAGLRADLP